MKSDNVPMTMKINELAEYSGLTPYSIRKMCKDGELEHIRVGNTYYVVVQSLMRLVRTGSN